MDPYLLNVKSCLHFGDAQSAFARRRLAGRALGIDALQSSGLGVVVSVVRYRR
jgi:hypothetical protein